MKVKRLKDGRISVKLEEPLWKLLSQAMHRHHMELVMQQSLPHWADAFMKETIRKIEQGNGNRHLKESEFYLVFHCAVQLYLPPGLSDVFEQYIIEPLRKEELNQQIRP